MGLLDQLRAWRRQGVIVEYRNVSSPRVLNYSIERLYREQPALRAVVSFLADNVSSLPLKVYDRASDTDRRRVTEGPAFGLLMRPNASTTAHDMTLGTVTDVLLYGWALWFVCPSADLESGWEATRIPVAWVQDVLTVDGLSPSAYRVQNPDGNRAPVELPARACVRFCQYDPMGSLHPHSPVESLKQVLSEQISAWEFRNGVWSNSGRVSQWISRPMGAEWEPGARDRFAKSWKERYSGEDGTNTGGTPLLEDGMRLETTQFNAREAQWQEATRLAREDVAAVYHVNPSLIWHTDGQTYASAKDNARALYADTLSPILNMYENVLNAFLLPMVGEEASRYVEFDLEAKLSGSFEERASVMQSAVGAPWMTRNEARAKLNMRALEGCDELIVPMNVTEGGLASPNDTDPTVERWNARRSAAKAGDAVPFGDDGEARAVVLKSRAVPSEAMVDEIAGLLARFVRRQAASVPQAVSKALAKQYATGSKAVSGDLPEWWDAERWDRELADDLEPLLRRIVDQRGMAALADIGEDVSEWDSERTAAFVRSMAELRAKRFNGGTLDAAMEVMGADGAGSVADAILSRAEAPAEAAARTYATAASGFATKEAVNQVYPRDTRSVKRTKTWHHNPSKNPRPDHEAMDGETVGLDEKFSNGADYPGDWTHGPADNVNCNCTMDVAVIKGGHESSDPAPASLDYFTQDDVLRDRVKLMMPEPGYEDFEDVGIHSDGMTFGYQHLGVDGRPNTWDNINVSVADLAQSIKESPSYHGGPVRLASCSAGKYPDGLAKRLANELGMPVRAADMDVWIEDDGWYTLAETKQEAIDIHEGICESRGNWHTFYPDGWEGKIYEP